MDPLPQTVVPPAAPAGVVGTHAPADPRAETLHWPTPAAVGVSWIVGTVFAAPSCRTIAGRRGMAGSEVTRGVRR
jgi:hypothetical protein